MKKALTYISTILAAACVFSAVTSAQNIESAYFLDNYTYTYRLNPALMPDNNFIALGIGNISANLDSKLGASAFLYPGSNGKVVTGFNSSVSAEDFASKFSEANKLGENINVNILAFGIRKEKSMTTVEVNMREDFTSTVPGDLFSFLKEGSSSYPYDLSSFRANAKAMLELALGHTRKFGNLTVGLRAKFLFGAAAGDIGFDRFNLTSSSSELGIDAVGHIKVACKPLEISGNSDNPLYINDVRFVMQNIGTAGFGVGFDLGAKWYINENLSVTLGANDLGGVSWKYNNVINTEFNAKFNGLTNVTTETDITKALEDFWKEAQEKAKMNKAENVNEWESLPFNINAGVRYRMPFYDRLSVGFLTNYDHSRYGGILSGRAGVTVTPINWFSITGNIGVSNYSGVTGCMASLTLLGINLFAGFDGYLGKVSSIKFGSLGSDLDPNLPIQKVNVPLNAFRYKFTAGVTIQFGKRRADYIKEKADYIKAKEEETK